MSSDALLARIDEQTKYLAQVHKDLTEAGMDATAQDYSEMLRLLYDIRAHLAPPPANPLKGNDGEFIANEQGRIVGHVLYAQEEDWDAEELL